MDFRIENEGNVLTAYFNGRLDTPAAAKLSEDIKELLDNADKEIILDCSGLEYISSSGLRLFLQLRKESGVKGGKLSVKNINDEIKKVFMMTGFLNLFTII